MFREEDNVPIVRIAESSQRRSAAVKQAARTVGYMTRFQGTLQRPKANGNPKQGLRLRVENGCEVCVCEHGDQKGVYVVRLADNKLLARYTERGVYVDGVRNLNESANRPDFGAFAAYLIAHGVTLTPRDNVVG